MHTKKDHFIYLKDKGYFNIQCSLNTFTIEEIKILKKYGYWFNGLTNGDLTPFTKKQKQFVTVFMNNAVPKTVFEKIWFRYLFRRQQEPDDPNLFNLDYQIKEEGFHTREDYYKLHPSRRNRW